MRTLIDLATRLTERELEAAVNEADKLDLVDPDSLRSALEPRAGQRGVAALRRLLDRHTFALTDSELERLLLPIARRAGLPEPLTKHRLNGFRVDFYWPELGLVVETDGFATTERQPSRRTTGAVTRRTPPPGSPRSASPTHSSGGRLSRRANPGLGRAAPPAPAS